LCNRVLMAKSLDPMLRIDAASVQRLARELSVEIGLEADLADPALLTAAGLHEVAPPPVGPPRPPARATGGSDDAPFLCVAADYGDHVKAAAFIRAFEARPESGTNGAPSVVLLRVHDSDALANCGRLYAGLDATRSRVDLAVPEGPHDAIVVELMTAFASAVDRRRPRAVVVFDGSPTAFACATVARARRIPVVHVGGGLRIPDRFVAAAAMRKMTDHLADLLFTTDAQASQTLADEGMPPERVHCVGNLEVDAIRHASGLRASPRPHFRNHHGYALVVLSEPVNM